MLLLLFVTDSDVTDVSLDDESLLLWAIGLLGKLETNRATNLIFLFLSSFVRLALIGESYS